MIISLGFDVLTFQRRANECTEHILPPVKHAFGVPHQIQQTTQKTAKAFHLS